MNTQRRPLALRFWAKVSVPFLPGTADPDHSRCWDWHGTATGGTQGETGSIRAGGAGSPLLKAPRVALALHEGVPERELVAYLREIQKLDACHRCDRPICCNPSHLFWGSHRWNMHDYVMKYGRLGIAKVPPPPRPAPPDAEPPF